MKHGHELLNTRKSYTNEIVLVPTIEVEAFKDLRLFEQDHSHDFEIGTTLVSTPHLFNPQPKSIDIIGDVTLESYVSNFAQSFKVQLEIIFSIHRGMHTRVGRPIHHPQRFHDFVFKLTKVVSKPTNYSEVSQTPKWVDTM